MNLAGHGRFVLKTDGLDQARLEQPTSGAEERSEIALQRLGQRIGQGNALALACQQPGGADLLRTGCDELFTSWSDSKVLESHPCRQVIQAIQSHANQHSVHGEKLAVEMAIDCEGDQFQTAAKLLQDLGRLLEQKLFSDFALPPEVIRKIDIAHHIRVFEGHGKNVIE